MHSADSRSSCLGKLNSELSILFLSAAPYPGASFGHRVYSSRSRIHQPHLYMYVAMKPFCIGRRIWKRNNCLKVFYRLLLRATFDSPRTAARECNPCNDTMRTRPLYPFGLIVDRFTGLGCRSSSQQNGAMLLSIAGQFDGALESNCLPAAGSYW